MKVFEKELQLWKRHADERIVEKLPPHLDIELTNRCNLSCSMCPYHRKDAVFKQDPCDMNFKIYKKIINEASEKNVRSVKLSFSGEPLLYKRFIEAVEYAKKRGLQVNVNSNGTLLDYQMCRDLVKSKLDVIIISDYHNSEQLQGITTLYIQKIEQSSKTPYILMKTNNPEKFRRIVDECVGLGYENFTKLEENRSISDFECGFPWQRLLITADGSVLNCMCGMGLYDLQQSYVGNVRYSDLEDLWNSTKMNFLRMCHETHESHLIRMCRVCPIRNRGIRKMEEK